MSIGIVADIGNSRVKLGFFEDSKLLAVEACLHAEFPEKIVESEPWQRFSGQSQYIALASVGDAKLANALEVLAKGLPHARWIRLNVNTAMPIGNEYASKETLGIDRLCVSVAAYAHAGAGPVLALNAGTALTFDYVDARGNYQGGSIAPGLRSRFRALHEFTAALPMVEAEGPAPLVGDSTETSIRSGVVNGMLAEIEGLVQQYREMAGSMLKVYLTGGDAVFLGNHLKSVTFVDANLLLYGINTIVLHHA